MPGSRTLTCAAAAILGGLAVAACQVANQIVIYNNAGTAVTLELQPGNSIWGGWSRSAVLRQGERKILAGDRLPREGVVLRSGDCRYLYRLPRLLDESYFGDSRPSGHHINVQVERDLSVSLLPESAAAIDPDAHQSVFQRKYGYPLQPASKEC